MAQFPSYQSYGAFVHHIHWVNRHFLDEKQTQFLEALKETAVSRTGLIPAGTFLFRAQEGVDMKEKEPGDFRPAPFSEARLRPLPSGASEGRANPKGMPCLYLASHPNTAVAEVRPWKNAFVSMGRFKILRELKVVDFSQENYPPYSCLNEDDASQEECEKQAWSELNEAFRRPVTRRDNRASYASTQIIADFFKAAGYDGVAYGSALGEGTNYAIFDLTCVEMTSAEVYVVKDIVTVAEVEPLALDWKRPAP